MFVASAVCFVWNTKLDLPTHGPPRTKKCSHGFCYSVLPLKNYFATVFSVISFQFLANKQYPNKPLVCLEQRDNYILEETTNAHFYLWDPKFETFLGPLSGDSSL